MNLIVGSNGYLARNLLNSLDPEKTITISRQPSSKAHQQLQIHISESTGEEKFETRLKDLLREATSIIILSVPPFRDYFVSRHFFDFLKNLVFWYSQNVPARKIWFRSSTMAYFDGEVTPVTSYEYFKLEYELFLRYVFTAIRPDMSITTLRLPILFGGISPNKDGQFFYDVIDEYRQGNQWPYKEGEYVEWGTSWVYVPDLCDAILNSEFEAGSRTLDISSGFVSYSEFHGVLSGKYKQECKGEMPLYKTRHFIKDQLNLLPRRLADVL